MVRDYVERLYTPAAVAEPSPGRPRRGQALATWKARVRRAWGRCGSTTWSPAGSATPRRSVPRCSLRAFVSLGELDPYDVEVQVVHGRVDEEDRLGDAEALSLRHVEAYEDGRHRFEGRVELARTGAFGYTVRVLPRNPLLATPAELGLVVNAVPLTAAPEVALR